MRLWTAESGFESLRPNHADPDSDLPESAGRMPAFSSFGRLLAWGAAWGAALGFWLLAPAIVERHHFALTRPAEWLLLDAALGVLFTAFGALLTVPVAAGLTLAKRRGRLAESRLTSFAIALPAWLAPAYLISGELIHLVRFRHFDAAAPYFDAFRSAAPALALTLVAGIALERSATRWSRSRGGTLLAGALALGALGGALRLPAAQPQRAAPRQARALPLASSARSVRPLLVIGLDGGNWATLRPLLGTGRLPTFDALVDRGLHGEVEALWPPYWSTSAWGAIATGASREETGVYEDLVAEAPGLPSFQAPLGLEARLLPVQAAEYLLVHAGLLRVEPPGRAALARPPVWELLDRSGVRTAVVRFNFTHPAAGQAAIVVSNRVVPDMWEELGVRPADPAAIVDPSSRREELLGVFSAAAANDREELARVLPPPGTPRPRDVELDPVEVASRVLPFDLGTFAAVEHLLGTDPDLGVVLLHLDGLDNVCHAFWPYRFPEQFRRRPSAAEIAALGPVVDRYLEFLERGLARMIAAFPEPPNVIVISDHGMGPLENGVPWRGWHASPGIFLAAGPDFSHRAGTLTVSYYDLAPTVLALQGLATPAEMTGRSLLRREEADRSGE